MGSTSVAGTASEPSATESPRPVSLVPRTIAFMLDQVAVFLLVVVPFFAAGFESFAVFETGQSLGGVLLVTATFVYEFATQWLLVLMAAAFVYHFTLEWQTGQTLGKRLLGLRVVADDGSKLGLRGSFLRNALRLVDGLGYWTVAVLVIVYRGDGKRLGDVVGHTLVVSS